MKGSKETFSVSTLDSNRCQETQITRSLTGNPTAFIYSEQS